MANKNKLFEVKRSSYRVRFVDYPCVNLLYSGRVVGSVKNVNGVASAHFNKGKGEDMVLWGDGLSVDDCLSLAEAVKRGAELNNQILTTKN